MCPGPPVAVLGAEEGVWWLHGGRNVPNATGLFTLKC